MSQFIDSDHANSEFKKALNEYQIKRLKIKDIQKRANEGMDITNEEVEWLCDNLLSAVASEEASWYNHD